MKKNLYLNQKGSALQIVLVIFMIMSFGISFYVYMMTLELNNYRYIDILMKQKNLEIMLTRYYLDQMENDLLISDSIEYDGYDISYQVEDMATYYDIITEICFDEERYIFDVKITNDFSVSFVYEEG